MNLHTYLTARQSLQTQSASKLSETGVKTDPPPTGVSLFPLETEETLRRGEGHRPSKRMDPSLLRPHPSEVFDIVLGYARLIKRWIDHQRGSPVDHERHHLVKNACGDDFWPESSHPSALSR
jgi:hypothetical protein